MKKLILSVFAMASLALAANAVTNMCVKTSDGKVVKYDVENVTEVYYEESTTPANQDVTVSGKVGDYDYVDLGLPSGLMWATYNVGATKLNEYGAHFAWGEVTPKVDYGWSTYKWCKGEQENVSKYNTSRDYGTVDGKHVLESADDAATANWGSSWRMPTSGEFNELVDGCTWKWVENFNGSGVNGQLGTSKTNGNTIFLHAAGYRDSTVLYYSGYTGSYWTSSLHNANSYFAFDMEFGDAEDGRIIFTAFLRNSGQSVRAVYSNVGVTVSGKKGDYAYVDLGLPSGLKWATCNVGATKPTEYGDYFTWGDVQPGGGCREQYKWIHVAEFSTYEVVTKYSTDHEQTFMDNITVLESDDDAATVNLGSAWRMPTAIEQQELIEGCDWKTVEDFNGTGIAGNLGTSKFNGNTIFLPAAGYFDCYNADAFDAGNGGYYWSSSLDEKNCIYASLNNNGSIQSFERFYAASVRGVFK